MIEISLSIIPIIFYKNKVSTFFNKNPLMFSLIIFTFFLFFKVMLEYNIYYLMILFFSISMIVYFIIYYCNKMELSIKSFLTFFSNIIIAISFILGFIVLIKGIPEPIYINDITILTQYRYLILSILAIVFIIIYVKYPQIFSILTFPYLKEEIKKFLILKQNSIFGPFFTYILDKLDNAFNQKIFIFIHSFLFVFLRLINLMLFMNFVFLNGDLRYVLYFLPISFCIWILSFIEYYFNDFFLNEKDYIRCLLHVTPLNTLIPSKNGIIYTKTDNFSFKLTPFAYREGYIDHKMDILVDLWFENGRLDVFFSNYKKKLKIINMVLTVLQILCWFFFVNKFFLQPTLAHNLFSGKEPVTIPFLRFLGGPFRPTTPLYAPYAAYRVPYKYQQEFAKNSDGTYAPGHPILADTSVKNPDNPNQVLYGGSATHGPGTPENPSVPLASTSLDGSNAAQRVIVPKYGDTWIDQKYCVNKMPGSDNYMADTQTKITHFKEMPQKEET